MKSSDLEYLFSNIPDTQPNVYPDGIVIENIALYKEYLEVHDFNYKYKKVGKGFWGIDLLRADGSKISTIKNPVYPTNSKLCFDIARDKYKTEQYLKAAGVGTTNSNIYDLDQLDKAKEDLKDFENKGIVIKPLNLAFSKGVFSHVSAGDFDYYWNRCAEIIRENKRKEKKILVQEYVEGFEARVTILEGHVTSVITRVPGYVIGDGESTIDKLIDFKNDQKNKCGFLRRYPIKKTDMIKRFLSQSGHTLDSVPDKGEYVLLISVSNLVHGGEIVDITDLVSDDIKETALDGLAAIPGMNCGGIDIMIKGFDDRTPTIIEVNAFPLLSVTKYPTYGRPSKSLEYYIEATMIRDKCFNNVDNGYQISEESTIISNYFNFFERKQKLSVNQFTDRPL